MFSRWPLTGFGMMCRRARCGCWSGHGRQHRRANNEWAQIQAAALQVAGTMRRYLLRLGGLAFLVHLAHLRVSLIVVGAIDAAATAFQLFDQLIE
jgi:hypothetical protein